ncbi:chromosome segregation protein [Purpureocillium lavendulum]|uniref:Chromosome segregation protein n=1 Tax=Purpureocillium lavendulum TaxID=1247861 RepID=A0AB34FXT5_9HYPO|nr:chromosome segregation protein [Purpureocillium lavendulum]
MSDSEPDFDDSQALTAAVRKATTTKRPRGRPPSTVNKVVKPGAQVALRRVGDKASAFNSGPPRQVLADKSNTISSRGGGRGTKKALLVDEKADVGLDDRPVEPVAPKTTRGRPKGSGRRKSAGPEVVMEQQSGRSRVEEVPETQQSELMRVDAEESQADVDVADSDVDVDESDVLHGHDVGDASLRHRFGVLKGRYDNLEARYRDLKEVGVKAAERNFEHLKQQADANISGSNELISQLRAELASQTALAQDGERLRQELGRSEDNTETLQCRVNELTASLTTARNEITALSTKLAASRSAEAQMKAPGSALNPGSAASRNAHSEAIQAAQAKEDLYGDLTGLIVRGLRRGAEEDVFDCIQTGRNGTLHFKLALERGDGSDSYEDVQLTYRPQLDAHRDGELMGVLPDYLTEEITFPRPHASKFYSRVTKSLTERLE